MSVSLPAASAPVAQFAHWISQFGVSGILFFTGSLFAAVAAGARWRRWCYPAIGLGVIVLVSASGLWLRSHVSFRPLSFSALLVQPHWKAEGNGSAGPSIGLDRLTRLELKRGKPVDLVVWPECSLQPSSIDELVTKPLKVGTPISLGSFAWNVRHTYTGAGLAGVVLSREVTEIKYGLPVSNRRAYNCACLVPPSGAMDYQEKLALVPLKEGLPQWLDQPWVRASVVPFFGLSAFLSPGDELRLLRWTRPDGVRLSIVAPICYESYLPWLPHYRKSQDVDAIIHLAYDGDFAKQPECATRQLWACQYRAIETRKWNLVCTFWTGSAMIDPVGEVVARLGDRPGVLRSDQISGTIGRRRD